MHFATFLSGGFITAIVKNQQESNLAKLTSVQPGEHFRGNQKCCSSKYRDCCNSITVDTLPGGPRALASPKSIIFNLSSGCVKSVEFPFFELFVTGLLAKTIFWGLRSK